MILHNYRIISEHCLHNGCASRRPKESFVRLLPPAAPFNNGRFSDAVASVPSMLLFDSCKNAVPWQANLNRVRRNDKEPHRHRHTQTKHNVQKL